MPIASKWLQLQTSNLTDIFSWTRQTWPPKFFVKKGRGQGHVTPNFGGKMPIAPKRLGATDFKFGMQVFRDNNTNITPNIFLQKGRGQVRVALIFPPHPCLRPRSGNPLECWEEILRQKTRIMGIPAFFVLTQYRRVTDRQIDGRTGCDRRYPR